MEGLVHYCDESNWTSPLTPQTKDWKESINDYETVFFAFRASKLSYFGKIFLLARILLSKKRYLMGKVLKCI